MTDGINIAMPEVSATASRIRSENQQLTAKLQEMTQTLNALQATWQSDASNTLVAKVRSLAPKIDGYRQVVDSYARFLDKTVADYNAADTSISSGAGGL